ncbi:phage tail sheath family protein [Aquimarina sp. LLG6339-5]|uniref:phage tail sheath family protein n=1 Tax=Aquimarina sp. LLG6339-5 TaxID=3160830 RepID=UPI0038654B80
MATYKTPGVYIEEIVKFPPSVAQVETAIPAFIGYTEKATKKVADDLLQTPTRITSMLEYETYFGFALPEVNIEVTVFDALVNGDIERNITIDKDQVVANRHPYLMYYALQMYFANGGGPCYIVSVANYSGGNVLFNDLNEGLDILKKEDEPTLLLFPDATSIADPNEFFALYNNALTQCNELQDRFTIIDTYTYDDTSDAPIAALRSGVNLEKDYLKYGAAYYPYLETILDYSYDEANVAISHTSEDETPESIAAMTAATQTTSDIQTVLNGIPALVTALTDADTVLQAGTNGEANTNRTTITDTIQPIVDALNSVITSGASAVTDGNAVGEAGVTAATGALNAAITGASAIPTLITTLEGHITDITGAANSAPGGGVVKTESAAAVTAIATIEADIQAVIALITPALTDAIIAAQAADDVITGSLDGQNLAAIENIDSATYNLIKVELGILPLELPPSSAMAGVYARVDSDRGVWKAPANVGVNYVIKPSIKITNEEQDRLNVDTVAGKSVNAIRTFTGKGTLVWGSRTLAGNDKEWRYVPVRRFFNMAEESIKKATEQFVFEPNDMNTWVRVKAMINNFLTLQWRAGALAGPTPDKAFYVNVGLGETMTADDILDGNMIIEIGMAVVRPAEFIILKFSHKMQEA